MTDFAALDKLVGGRVALPGEAGHAEGSTPFNTRYAHVRPAAVLAADSPKDVATGITWAREHGVPLVARGGGHSYAGYSSGTGLVIDLRGLDHVDVDPDSGLVTVGGGVRMKALYDALSAHDVAFPAGNSDDVAIGGLTLGGGVAAVSRAFGLTCDALVSTDVVLADGTLLTCDAERNADLFWACRGGGGGNFGVNTSFTFQSRPTVPASTFLALWGRGPAAEVLAALQEIGRDAPDEFAIRIGVNRAAGGEPVVSAIGQLLGPAERLREILAPALAVAEPSRVDIADRTYWEAKDYLHHNTSGGMFAVRTRHTTAPLPSDGVAALLAAVDRWPGSGNPDGGGVALFSWGGAINRVPVGATAFPHRDVLFLLSMDTSWTAGDGPGVEREHLAWLTDLHAEMGAHARDSAYVNFTDPDLRDWRSAYHGPNHDRLLAVKRRYDPDRVFTFGQAI